MELIKIVNARHVFENIADKENVSAHLSYWMAKFFAKTEAEHSFYVSEMRKILDRFAVKKEGEDDVTFIPSDSVADFNFAVENLNKTDVEDPNIRFKLSEVAAELKLSMRQMYSLLDFIDEDK